MSAASSTRRSPGRPAANDGGDSDGQRTRLLDAALARFVRDGMSATTARGIAEEAGVTPALLRRSPEQIARTQHDLLAREGLGDEVVRADAKAVRALGRSV